MTMDGPKVDMVFRVKGTTKPGEVMCVVGDCPELGSWKPHQAKILVLERHDEEGEIWAKTIKVPASRTVRYRYFIAHLRESEDQDDLRDVMVIWWETHLQPRSFNFQQYCVDPKSQNITEVADFGFINNQKSIDKGWLSGQTEIHLRLHSNPIHMWKNKYHQQNYRVKCTALDLRYKDLTVSYDDDDESNHDLLSAGYANRALVSVYHGECDEPSEQPQFGTIYPESSYMTFQVQTYESEFVGYLFDFYLHDPNPDPNDIPKHIGQSYVLPKNLKEKQGFMTISINGLKNKPIGQLTIDYLIIKPLKGEACDMTVSYARLWKKRRPLDVGHRGMGSSYGVDPNLKKCEHIKENTIHSLAEAGSHGADFVEFDVQVTKDKIPVIYHDFNVALTLKRKQDQDLDWFDIPVNELNLDQLQILKLDHVSEKTKGSPSHRSVVDPAEMQLFPTLEQCLKSLDEHIGFFVEVKYCMNLKTGELEEGLKYFLERNEYVDIIINDVLKHAGNRRIIFLSFDPDICTMIRLKQNKYPVMYIPLGGTNMYEPYAEPRSGDVVMAMHFAHGQRMLGVNLHAEDIFSDNNIICELKNRSLIVFCWGEAINSKESIKQLKDLGLDGVIYDRIAELKDTNENIFKVEKEAKVSIPVCNGIKHSASKM